MKSNLKLGFVGLLLVSAFGAFACVGAAEPPGTEGPVAEAKQELVTCASDCTGVPNSQPISQTCQTSCTATNTSITCDGVTTYCVSCAADYGQTCVYEHCGRCGLHGGYVIYGTYDCSGTCQSDNYCCCSNGWLC
jgi:hypothetical protein